MTIKYGLELENALARGTRVAEVSIGRVQVHPKWRWDVTWYQTMEGDSPGVFDRRFHLDADCGYTRTFWGAAIEMVRAVRRGRVQR